MPVDYSIYRKLGLVHVRYSGFVILDDTFRLFAKYLKDPEFRPGQRQLVDLSRITGFEHDYPKLLRLQASKVDAFLSGPETMLVYYAPTEEARSMARGVVRSWEDVGSVVPLILSEESEVISVLGLYGTLEDLEKPSV